MNNQPSEFFCPISMCVMEDPVIVSETGVTYERREIEAWVTGGNRTCPCTGVHITNLQLIPNRALKSAIDTWKKSETDEHPATPSRQPSSPVRRKGHRAEEEKQSFLCSWFPFFRRPALVRKKATTAAEAAQKPHAKKATPRAIANQMTAAVRRQDEAGLYQFSQQGWTFDTLDDYGQGPIHVAANQDDTQSLNLLISCGASTEFKDKGGYTALHWASRWGHHSVCKSLIHSGANVNAQSLARTTPLHMASYWGRIQVVELLFNHGADIHARNEKRQTPIEVAQQSPWDTSMSAVKLLQHFASHQPFSNPSV